VAARVCVARVAGCCRALVDESPIRTNLYVALIGEPGSGKTTAIQKAIWLLGMSFPILLEDKIGSGEGLAKRIGAQGILPGCGSGRIVAHDGEVTVHTRHVPANTSNRMATKQQHRRYFQARGG